MKNEFNNSNEIKYDGVIGEVNEQEKNINSTNKEKELTPLNIFLIILLIIQIASFFVLPKIMYKPHKGGGKACIQAFDCKNCNEKTCDCKYCTNEDCSETNTIKCPNYNQNNKNGGSK